ncbi:MAG: hypothetical protein Q4P34_00780, partial [Tissierellia bacterium]|nr:hypothetical protein [Tissierellia bacterium]
MNKSLRKIMAFALVLVMAFTTFGPIAMAQSVQPTHEALINEYYREDHGSLSLKFEDCFKTYSVSLKVQDDK